MGRQHPQSNNEAEWPGSGSADLVPNGRRSKRICFFAGSSVRYGGSGSGFFSYSCFFPTDIFFRIGGKDIVIDAQENSIRKLLSVLIDNAVKYAGSSGWVVIRLWAEEKVVHLDILNSCENVEELDFQKLFDRFYCADQSRSRVTGGYGIGLSIAKAIVEIHKAKIAIRQEGEKGICFLSRFSRSRKKIVRRKNSWDNPAVFLVILIPDSLGSIE